nr:unnamed protein product [Callosobruchus chinensis]
MSMLFACVCGTQTQNIKQASKSTKKKRKLVVCCHCCCHCGKDDVRGGEDAKIQVNPDSWDNVRHPQQPGGSGLGGKCCRCTAAATNHPAADYDVYQNQVKQDKINPVRLKQFKPWDAALYQQKAFPKYGAPSKNYPWVQRTTSDILDKYYKLKISEEFSSPVTGGASVESSLPEPIEVKEDIQYLEKLETNAKHDIPSRIMLNAMCDAILYSNVDADCPSMLLSEFTYLDKDKGGGCSKNNHCSSTQSADFPRGGSNNSTQTQAADDKSIRQHVEDTVMKLLEEKEERLGGSDNTFKERIERAGLQKAFNQEEDKEDNSDHKSLESLNNFGSKKHCCFRAHEARSVVPRLYPTFTKTGLLPSICPYKRSASPARNDQVKKSRPCLDGGDSMAQSVNDLLDKIDEVALRSQENDQKVQNVLHSTENPEQIHVERTSGFHVNFESSLSGEMSSTEIFRKIDEIVQRSQLNNNKIQNVLNIIPKVSNSPRDYVSSHQGPPCISSDDSAVVKTERLCSIPEMPQETAEETKETSSTSLKLDGPTNAPSEKKKKKGGTLKSLIPIKKKTKNK